MGRFLNATKMITDYIELDSEEEEMFDWWVDEHIKLGNLQSMPLVCTPKMAKDLLKRNTRNRNLIPAYVNKLVGQLKAGNWKPRITDCIGVSDENRLINGQHRLMAIYKAEIPANLDFMFGVPDENGDVIDIGKKRTLGDVFSFNGVSNGKQMASLVQNIYSFDKKTQAERKGLGLVGLPNPDEFYLYYKKIDKYHRVQPSLSVRNKAKNRKMIQPILWGTAHYMISERQHDTKLADKFFDVVLGVGVHMIDPRDPAKVLRDWFDDYMKNPLTNGRNMPKLNFVAQVVHAWNWYQAVNKGIKLGSSASWAWKKELLRDGDWDSVPTLWKKELLRVR